MTTNLPLIKLLAPAQVVQALAKSALPILEDASFQVTDRGLELSKLNSTRAAMVHFFAAKEAFRLFEFQGDKVEFTVKSAHFLKFAQRAKGNKDAIALTFDGHEIKLNIVGPSADERAFDFDNVPPPITIEDVSTFDPPLEVPYDTRLKISSEIFKQRITDAIITGGDELKFSITEIQEQRGPALRLTTKGVIAREASAIRRNMEGVMNFESGQVQEEVYPLDYLKDVINSCSGISDVLTLEFGQEKPLHIKYEVAFPGLLEFWISCGI